MSKPKIPKRNADLLRYAVSVQLKRVIGCLVYYGAFAAAYLFYLQGALRKPLPPLLLAVFIAVVAISGAVIFRLDKFFLSRSYAATVRSLSVSRSYGRGLNREAKFSYDFHSFLNIKSVDRKGRERKCKIQLFDDGYDGYYREGDRIVAFRGLNYPLSLEAEARGEHICCVCGVRSYDRDARGATSRVRGEKDETGTYSCPSCGRSMIDVSETDGYTAE